LVDNTTKFNAASFELLFHPEKNVDCGKKCQIYFTV